MGWFDRQFNILLLGGHNCAGEDQLEERRWGEERERP